jgi:hypothetical protein
VNLKGQLAGIFRPLIKVTMLYNYPIIVKSLSPLLRIEFCSHKKVANAILDRNLNNESLVTDINNIVKQQNGYRDHNWSKKTESIRSEPGQKLSMVSPGSQRWNLQRKDSIHSLASEPAKIDNVTPFQRGAKSHTSLHRSEKIKRLLFNFLLIY